MGIRVAVFGLACMVMVGAAEGMHKIDNGAVESVLENTSYGTNSIVMGIATSNNGLRIYGGNTLWSGPLFAGYASDSTNNWVQLRAGSGLTLSGSLFVGYDSSGNSLTTSDGSAVSTRGDSYIGYFDSAEKNSVVISGDKAYWSNTGSLNVGYGGNDNELVVSNGATLALGGSLWLGGYITADHNTATISDATLYAAYDVVVGYEGDGNRLFVADGSEVDSMNGYVGYASGADNNLVVVSGGSVWTNYGGLYIGDAANTGNAATVTNGGSIVVYDGLGIYGTGNEFNLDKGGALTIYTNFNASMNGFNFNKGGALHVGGTLTGASSSIEDGRTISLVGGNAWWDQAGSNVVVGGASSGNALRVRDGGLVEAAHVFVGSGDTASGNTASVTGSNSWLVIADSLTVGTASNANNLVEVSSGGTILLGGDLLIGGAGNTFNLGNGGWLVASNGLDASMPGFNFLAGGTLESRGVLSGVHSSIEDQRAVLLTGSNAVWNLGANVLQLGYTSSSNELHVADGAYLASSGAMIGSAGTTSNLVSVSGAGSVWAVSGDLAMDGYYNDLLIANNGYVAVGQSLSVKNQSAISFIGGGHASASDYYQDAASVFSFDSVTNSPSSPALLVVDDAAEFEGGATLAYTGSIGGLERGIIFSNRLVAAGTLIVNGVTNASNADLDALNITGSGSLFTIDLVVEDDDLIALITRMRLADSAGFSAGTDMDGVSEQIDLMADAGNVLAKNLLDTLTQFDGAGQNAQLSQLYARHAPTYAHAKGMLDGFKQARTRGVVPGPMLPSGAMGPHFYGSQAQGWIKGFGSRGERDGSGAFSGYDQSTYGALGGLDKSYGELLAGVAGGMATTDISQDDGDDSEAKTYYGLLYASWGTLSWFGDLNLGYGRSSIEDRSGTAFNTTAEYDADQLGFYLGGGKELVFRQDRLFITPSAALSGSYYVQESYTEKSTTALPKRVDEFDYLSLQSELGLKASYMHNLKRSVIVPEIHANWLHEFNADEESIGYSLVGGTGSYSFGMEAPLEDLYEVGVGFSWWSGTKTAYEWAFGLDNRFGDGYSEIALSARLLVQF